jgi:hypothetical protein
MDGDRNDGKNGGSVVVIVTIMVVMMMVVVIIIQKLEMITGGKHFYLSK